MLTIGKKRSGVWNLKKTKLFTQQEKENGMSDYQMEVKVISVPAKKRLERTPRITLEFDGRQVRVWGSSMVPVRVGTDIKVQAKCRVKEDGVVRNYSGLWVVNVTGKDDQSLLLELGDKNPLSVRLTGVVLSS